tara:strand:- start:66 stop:185 length:120 start_codon:yes stop_codon:yes gene_type:complete
MSNELSMITLDKIQSGPSLAKFNDDLLDDVWEKVPVCSC